MDLASASVGLVPVGATTGSYIVVIPPGQARRKSGTKMTRSKKQFFSVKIKCLTAQGNGIQTTGVCG